VLSFSKQRQESGEDVEEWGRRGIGSDYKQDEEEKDERKLEVV